MRSLKLSLIFTIILTQSLSSRFTIEISPTHSFHPYTFGFANPLNKRSENERQYFWE